MQKKGIALLITLLFIVAITASIGLGLKQINNASKELQEQNFLLQTRVILDDVLTILKNSGELNTVMQESSPSKLYAFLSQTKAIPLELECYHVEVEVTSARKKFNVNNLMDANTTVNNPRVEMLKEFVNKQNINSNFIDLLLDNMGKIKDDLSYNSAIFSEKPMLFRDYIASNRHFEEIENYYESNYNDESLKKFDFDTLFSYGQSRKDIIDLNYATIPVWELLLGVDALKARTLASKSGQYTKLEDLDINAAQKVRLSKFDTSFFEPFLEVRLEIKNTKQKALIYFEYDMKTKKGSHYVYEL